MNNYPISDSLAGRRALVTGGSKGIGAAVVTRLAEAGAIVMTTARSTPDDLGDAAIFVAADVSTAGGVATVIDRVRSEFGALDILVNTVGGSGSGPGGFAVVTDEQWQSDLEANLLSAARLDRALIPPMPLNSLRSSSRIAQQPSPVPNSPSTAATSPQSDPAHRRRVLMTDPTDLVDRYFRLAPQADTDGYFAQFAPDASAEDEGHNYHGIDAIRAWRKEVPLVTYSVREVDAHDGEHIARAEIAGDFPGSPVTLAFHFTFGDDGLIQRLAIRAYCRPGTRQLARFRLNGHFGDIRHLRAGATVRVARWRLERHTHMQVWVMETAKPLRGIELRYVLTVILANGGIMTVRQLSEELGRQGFSVNGRPSKAISDALRWEAALDGAPHLAARSCAPGGSHLSLRGGQFGAPSDAVTDGAYEV